MPLLILLERLFKWLLLASLIGLGLGYWQRDALPDPGFYAGASQQAPRQTKTTRQAFTAHAGDQAYRITPLFDYELHGVVVSQHHSDDWKDIYHHQDWQDFLNIKDICVIWGDNVSTAVYQDLAFNNTTWTCWVHWPDGSTRRRFKDDQLSNNHLLADRPAVQQAILQARPGDQIRLRGVLASYANPGNGFQRGSSTSRSDRGNGACETIYVDDFHIVRAANRGWRSLYQLCLWLAPITAAGFFGLLMVAPVRRGLR